MFVRIVHTHAKDGRVFDSLYECTRVYFRPLLGLEGPISDKFDLELEGPGTNHIMIQIDKKEKTDIFVMNESGKTIDSMRYPLHRFNKFNN